MVQESTQTEAARAASGLDEALAKQALEELGAERLVQMYREMLHMRRFEEQAGRVYQMGKIKGFCHLYIGQEAVAVGAMAALKPEDYVVSGYREHGQAIAKGVHPDAVMAELFGKVTGCSGGKGGSMHLFDVKSRFYGGWGIVGGHIPTATGIAFASKYRGEGAVCLCFFGDGAIHQGAFHEALNMASLWKLPVVFIIENNRYAMGTSLERSSAVTDLTLKAQGYNVEPIKINGQDLFEVYDKMKHAVALAREQGRPSLVDIATYRFRGHSMSDPAKYRTKDELDVELGRDPIQQLHNWLVEHKLATDDALKQLDKDVKAEVKASIQFAEESPFPDDSALFEDVCVEWPFDIER